ncbi:MAG: response regulator [Elainellaceae cyanobacterium]
MSRDYRSSIPVEILLVEDSPEDADLTVELLSEAKVFNRIHVVEDGVEAINFLRRRANYANSPRPDLILLDLNLPRKNGRELLSELKEDPDLKLIPVVVLTTSASDEDILRSYELNANCYVTKPVSIAEFSQVIQSIENFWLVAVKFPQT